MPEEKKRVLRIWKKKPEEDLDPLALDPNVWTQNFCCALAQLGCTHCFGLGVCFGRDEKFLPCNCVFRKIFRSCYAKFRVCCNKEAHIGRISLEANPGSKSNRRANVWGMKHEEFIADFVLVSRRVLEAEKNGLQWRIFNYHYLLGADWKLCSRKLGLDRGEFFHEAYRVEQKLGRVFGQLKPYRLFPTQEYFSEGCGTPGPEKGMPVVEQAVYSRRLAKFSGIQPANGGNGRGSKAMASHA